MCADFSTGLNDALKDTANRLQRWSTTLLNYNFRMEFLSSQKLSHADGLSRLIPEKSEPLEDMVIAALRAEIEVKNTERDYKGTPSDSERN